MAVFFFVVGLEIKRELVNGQLRDPRFAALPAVAALGGMVVPAVIYFAFNAGGPGQDGWGIPMATDIAFVMGAISLLGKSHLSPDERVLADAGHRGRHRRDSGDRHPIFYTSDLSANWLLTAAILLAAVIVLRRLNVWYLPV